MELVITDTRRSEHGFYFSGTCGKVSALVSIHSWGVQVICENSAHRVWRGAGRHFANVGAAREGYKSGEMKALISAAAEASLSIAA